MIRIVSLLFAASLAIAPALADPAPSSDWHIAGPFGGNALAIAVDPANPSTVLAGGMQSLLFKSEDGGAHWELLNFPQRALGEVTSILIDPKDSNHYLVGMLSADDGALFESYNAGKTWAPNKDLSDTGVRALAVSASDPTEMVAGTLRGVQLSTDSGKTWTRISDPQIYEMHGITAVAIDPQDPNIIYAGTPHLPWRTTDRGKTWGSISTGLIDDSDVFSIYINPSLPSEVFASACSGIYSTENRGDQWHKLLGIPNTSRRTHVIQQDPFQPETIYAGTTVGLFKTINNGKTWKLVTDNQVNAIALDHAHPGTMYIAFEYDGLGKSANRAETIDPIDNGFVDRQIADITVSGPELVAIEPDAGETTAIFSSADQGSSWTQLSKVRGLEDVHLDSIAGAAGQSRDLIAASPHALYKSMDGGMVWRPLPVRVMVEEQPKVSTRQGVARNARSRAARRPLRPIIRIVERHPNEIYGVYSFSGASGTTFFAATDLGLLTSMDMGERWKVSDLPLTSIISAVYASAGADKRILAKTNLGLFASSDCGQHWTAINSNLPVADINGIAIPADDHGALLAAARTGLYMSQDGGTTWKIVPHLPVATFTSVIYPGLGLTAYAVEYGELYRSDDGGESWSKVPTGYRDLRINRLWASSPNGPRLYAITTGLGILFRE
jgi:photosystem II stability/assembly factor-like uncharacterized protein